MPNAPLVGLTSSGQKIKQGGFSGLQFVEEKDGILFFQTLTDRGPNAEMDSVGRPFLIPEFSPEILILKADTQTNQMEVAAEIKLKKIDGTPLTGLPNTRLEENPVDIRGLYLSIDPMGLDTEGLVKDNEGGWWIADEYAPSLVHFDEDGRMLRRLTPTNELPRIYGERKSNRGFEGIAKIKNKLFGFLQSPLSTEESFARIVEVDLNLMKTSAEYFYPFEKGNDKIGDALAIGPKSFLVLEQNGKTGPMSQKYIYKITLGPSDELVQKKLVADLAQTPFNDVEKIEGMAMVDEFRLALIYDNDFQLSGKTNYKTGITPINNKLNQLLLLYFKESLKK